MSQPRIGVIVRRGLNPTDWEARHLRGEVVDRTPYAYHLAGSDFALEWSKDDPEGALGRWWRMTLKRLLGFDLVHVWRNRGVIERADAVWTHTEREHLAVALLKTLQPRRFSAVSIAQSVWLWDRWSEMSGIRRSFFTRLLRKHSVEVLLSRVNRDLSRAAVPGRTVIRIPFGTHRATPATPEDAARRTPRVLVVGNDRHRDWPLIAEVAAASPEIDFDIVSLSDEVRSIAWTRNVDVRGALQSELLGSAYQAATLVALPLRPNRHASGCTVAIEALSAGIPVVATDAGGIDDYLADSAATLVPVGDAAAFSAAVRELAWRTDPADPDVACRRGLSERDYVARLMSITTSLLENRPIDEAVSLFERMPQLAAETTAGGR